MISSEKKFKHLNLHHLNNLQVKKSSPAASAFIKHIFPGWKKLGYRESDTILHLSPARGEGPPPPCGSPEAKASGSRFTSIASSIRQGLRTVSTEGGRVGVRDGFSPGKFFWLGFGYFQLQVQLQMRRKSCFQIGDSEILNQNGLKQLLKNCKKPNVERTTRTILTQISSCDVKFTVFSTAFG